jgi:hypothetical protein
MDALWRGNVNYARIITGYSNLTGEDQRRYSPATRKVTEIKVLNGQPGLLQEREPISASHVERQILTMRMGKDASPGSPPGSARRSSSLHTPWALFMR